MDEQKAKKFYRAMINDQKRIFYATDSVTKGLMKKARTSLYPKGKVLVKIYNEIHNHDRKTYIINEKPPLNTPFVKKREDLNRSTLYSFSGPFEVLQADVADIRFLGKLAADPKYYLLFADLFTSMIYTYPMKRRSLLATKMIIFYQDIAKKE